MQLCQDGPLYIEGSQILIFKNCCISFSEDPFCFSKQYRPDEMLPYAKVNIMRHFIWIFTVCQSTNLGVSGPQRVIIRLAPDYTLTCNLMFLCHFVFCRWRFSFYLGIFIYGLTVLWEVSIETAILQFHSFMAAETMLID